MGFCVGFFWVPELLKNDHLQRIEKEAIRCCPSVTALVHLWSCRVPRTRCNPDLGKEPMTFNM